MKKRDLTAALVLGLLSVTLLGLLGAGGLPAWSLSPVSPLPVETTPMVRTPVYSGIRVSPVSPGNPPGSGPLARLLEGDLWTSPWSWVVLGIVLFGGLAVLLTALFQRLGSQA